MSKLDDFGELVREELGAPPPGWSSEQRHRLKGLTLAAPRRRGPVGLRAGALGVGALGAGALVAVAGLGAGLWLGVPERPGEDAPVVPALVDVVSGDAVSGDAVSGDASSGDAADAAQRTAWLAAEGQPTRFPLADDSTIELRPGARGRLDRRAGAETRFDLHGGTAIFELRPQQQPFSVVAGLYRIEVIGTRFLVTYGPGEHLLVVVEEGVVGVHLPGRPERVRLEAGDRLEMEDGELALRSGATGEDEPATGRPEQGPSPVDQPRASWQSLYRQGNVSEACARVKERGLSHWRESLTASELLELSAALRPCGDDEGALSMLQAVRARFPESARARDALFLMGRIEAGRGRPASAIANFEAYVADAPTARFATEALGRLIELHASRGDGARAKDLARRYLERAPDGPYRALAEDVLARGRP